MQLPTRQPQLRAVTASATRLTGRKTESDYAKRLAQPWQYQALSHYDEIGEVNFACDFYAKMLSRVRIFPATLNSDGTLDPIKEGRPVELLDRISDPGGKRSRLQFDYGRLKFITGEGILLVTGPETEDERWRFLWRDNVKVRDDGTAVLLNFQRQEVGAPGIAYRMWTPHPAQSDLAISPMRAVLMICEELRVLTASVMGTARTRLTNGIMAIASELMPDDDSDPGTDEDPRENVFLQQWIDHMQAQIENPAAAESKIPFTLVGAYDYMKNGEGVQWIKTHDPATDYMERDLRIEAVKRLALGLDMPPEVLLGMTDANHWTALQVQQDMWRSFGAPIADDMTHDFAEAYLRPALRDEGFADWEDIVIGYDDSQVVVNPDRTAVANAAADRGDISDEGYRTLMGIPETMAPSDEEKDRYLAIKLREPALLEGEDELGAVPQKGPVAAPAPSDAVGMPAAPSNGRVVSRQEAMTAAVVGAAHMALRSCRNKAGARLRQAHRSCPECQKKIDGLSNSLVASALGVRKLKQLGEVDHAALVKDGTVEFAGLLEEWGVDQAASDGLCERIELYAAKTLLEKKQPALPPGFEAQVEQSLGMEVAA